MSFPIPLLTERGSSVVMVATILDVAIIFIMDSRGGISEGSVRYLNIVNLLFVYVFSSRMKFSGIFSMVFLIITATGNIVNRTIKNILVVCPYPNMAANTGASTGTGITCVRKRNGNRIELIVLFLDIIIPIPLPTNRDKTNPRMASLKLINDFVNTV